MAKHDSFFRTSFSLLKETYQEWLQDKAPQLGAALAYYTVFSLAPLILVLLAIVGLIFHNDPGGAWKKSLSRSTVAHTALDCVCAVSLVTSVQTLLIS
jgi:uncharacterized BrkB/YihY/UPF0761 family membrane protein